MEDKRVRDLGGEIWSELVRVQHATVDTSLRDIEVLVTAEFIDLVMGVLARHDGKTISNRDMVQMAPERQTAPAH